MRLSTPLKRLPPFFIRLRAQPIELVLLSCALFSILILFLMLTFIVREGSMAFMRVGLELILGQRWETKHELYGAVPLMYSSIMIVSGALAISVPLGICTSIFISEILPSQLRDIVKSMIELLASIPSIIYGFIGVAFLVPLVASIFGLQSGATALTASLILAVMSLPTIVGLSGEIISAVPKEYKDAALAIGATRWQMIKEIVLPLSKSGILASVMLGFGRAIGETVAVLMVAGNVARIPIPPWNYLAPAYAVTAVIAIQMGEASVGSLEYSALFGLGLILFIITFTINTIADIAVRRGPIKRGVQL